MGRPGWPRSCSRRYDYSFHAGEHSDLELRLARKAGVSACGVRDACNGREAGAETGRALAIAIACDGSRDVADVAASLEHPLASLTSSTTTRPLACEESTVTSTASRGLGSLGGQHRAFPRVLWGPLRPEPLTFGDEGSDGLVAPPKGSRRGVPDRSLTAGMPRKTISTATSSSDDTSSDSRS